jgi:hypothetical protein
MVIFTLPKDSGFDGIKHATCAAESESKTRQNGLASNHSFLDEDRIPPDLVDQGAGGFVTDEYCVGPLTGPHRLGRKAR